MKLKALYDLVNQKKYEWNDEFSIAFKWVKNELIYPRVLVNYDPNEQLVLACDPSNYGLSAILSHRYKDGQEKPIAFASKKIAKSELNRTILDKKAMAIIFGFKKFYQFIFAKTFILKTDNRALDWILRSHKGLPLTADNRLQRYAYFASGFKYITERVDTKDNGNCDVICKTSIG